MYGWYLVGILGLALLMVVHEGGHFLAARAFGMTVTKFSIGFGPPLCQILPHEGYFWFTTGANKIKIRLWKHIPEKHGPTIYQVAVIPFLAYVQIAGMNPFEDNDPNDKGSYANASLIGRITTIFAGPLANYLFASVFFFGAFMIGGVPSNEAFVAPLEDRVAIKAGVKDGDKVLEVGGTPVKTWTEMAEQISKRPGQPTKVVLERNKEIVTLEMTPANEKGVGRIGVTAFEQRVPVSAQEATRLAITEPANVVKMLVVGLGQLLTGKVEGELSGPVGMVKTVANAAKRGTAYGLHLLGALSAYLGAFNLIPLPALDGGRLMFLTYEATTRRKPNARIEAWIHATGILMFLALMMYVTYKDIGSK